MEKVSKKVGWEITKKTFLPVIMLLAFIAAHINYNINISPFISEALKGEIKKYILTALIIIIAFIVQQIAGGVAGWYKESIASKTATKLDDKLMPLARRIVKVMVWIVAFLMILPLYGINISALIATLGVSSLAIALAAQDTISNVISGFMIMVDSPFRVGDKVQIPSGEVVIVLDIGVRRSRFLSEDKAIVIVPNLELSKSKIVNYTYGKEHAEHEV